MLTVRTKITTRAVRALFFQDLNFASKSAPKSAEVNICVHQYIKELLDRVRTSKRAKLKS